MLKIKYFARLREDLGIQSEELAYHNKLQTVAAVISELVERDDIWSNAFCADSKILVAVNQKMGTLDTTISDGDEIAFFPPVTGG